MKKDIYIFALHLSFGGVEKAITNMANIFCEKYNVHIICTYKLPNSPAYMLDHRVQIKYLLDYTPNRAEFKASIKNKDIFKIVKEGVLALRIIFLKKYKVKEYIKNIRNGIIITTRDEDTVILSKYVKPGVFAIAQLHHDHKINKKYCNHVNKKYKNIDLLVALCDQLKEELEELIPSNSKTRVITIPNFIESIPQKEQLQKKENLFISTGRLNSVKGFDRLLRIMSKIKDKLPEWKLNIIGSGELEEDLKLLIRNYRLEEYVTLCGKLSSDQIEEMNLKSSIYLMTSYSEGLPFVLIEAFSCGVPAIAFDVRVGPRAIIEDGINGFLVEDCNEDMFVDKVVELATDKVLRKKMSENAYNKSFYYSKKNVESMWIESLRGYKHD